MLRYDKPILHLMVYSSRYKKHVYIFVIVHLIRFHFDFLTVIKILNLKKKDPTSIW